MKALLISAMLVFVSCAQLAEQSQEQILKLATTTSTCDTGLLNEINRAFFEKHGVKVQVACMGTGASIRTGEQGGADVVIVHAPALEEASVARGYYVNRSYFMYNDFVILGPEEDPAGIKGTKNAAGAFRKIADANAAFFSRGDNSGTHAKELELWKAANVEPKGEWYKSAGKGMAAAIILADAQKGYTLADRGTYLAVKGDTDLIILVEGDAMLFNPYHVMAANPEKHPEAKYELAMLYITFLTSFEGQKIILDYGRDHVLDPNTGAKKQGFGEPLFVPSAMSRKP